MHRHLGTCWPRYGICIGLGIVFCTATVALFDKHFPIDFPGRLIEPLALWQGALLFSGLVLWIYSLSAHHHRRALEERDPHYPLRQMMKWVAASAFVGVLLLGVVHSPHAARAFWQLALLFKGKLQVLGVRDSDALLGGPVLAVLALLIAFRIAFCDRILQAFADWRMLMR